ncbi:MAG: response regulator [Candidatus Pacearchaeota archaeon]|jgi:CheY-like chemotaxis protein
MKKTILIVDNEEYWIEEISNKLKKIGYETIEINNADLAVSKINKGLEYDAMILDTNMYGKDVNEKGSDLVARVSLKKNPKKPIIIFSAWKTYIEGATTFFAKLESESLFYYLNQYFKENQKP